MRQVITRDSVLKLLRSGGGRALPAAAVAYALTGREHTLEPRHVARAEALLLGLVAAGLAERTSEGGEERFAAPQAARAAR